MYRMLDSIVASCASLLDTSELLSPEVAAAAKRAELSRNWPTAAQVIRSTGTPAANPNDLATPMRRSGQLLGVYLFDPIHHYRYPSWQFQPDGQPVEHFAEILAIMREYGTYLDENGRTTGWGEVEWFLSPHVLLDGAPPCDVLRD